METKLRMGILGLLLSSGLAAGSAQAKDLFFSVGYKGWVNSWTTTTSGVPATQGVNFPQFSSDPYLASIPNMSLRYKNAFISGSKYSSPEIEFPRWTDTFNFSGAPYTYNFDYRAKRDETDLNLGVYFYRSLALTAGYKEVKQTYKVHGFGTGVVTFDDESTTKYRGPTIGLSGSATLGEGSRTSVYGNVSYGIMSVDYEPAPAPGTPEDDATYQSSEVGLAWALGSRGSMSLGYKVQKIVTTPGDKSYAKLDLSGTDWTSGLIFGINLFFF